MGERETPTYNVDWYDALGERWITVAGEIDQMARERFREALNATDLNIDMLAVTRIDRAGLRSLVEAFDRAERFTLRPSYRVRRIVEDAGHMALLLSDESAASQEAG